jgi:hypothetical protein
MNKATIKKLFPKLLSDKRLLLVMILLVIVTLGFIIYVGLNVQSSELQLVVRYSAFGVTHFYRSQWFYLIGFGVFGLLVSTLHIMIALKLVSIEKNSLSIAVAWLGVALVLIAWAVSLAIFKVALLS